jgi:pheromone shutdown protein TraB
MTALILAVQVFSILLNFTGVVATLRSQLLRAWCLMFSGNVLALACDVALRLWPLVAVSAACALFAAWMWWRHRKNRGRLRAALSGKYRHVRDAMVATLRDRRVPRPVLAPGAAS